MLTASASLRLSRSDCSLARDNKQRYTVMSRRTRRNVALTQLIVYSCAVSVAARNDEKKSAKATTAYGRP